MKVVVEMSFVHISFLSFKVKILAIKNLGYHLQTSIRHFKSGQFVFGSFGVSWLLSTNKSLLEDFQDFWKIQRWTQLKLFKIEFTRMELEFVTLRRFYKGS